MMAYKTPKYITQAAKHRFGRRIRLIGVTEGEELRLWNQISVRAISAGKPERKNVSVTDVKTMSIVNRSCADTKCTEKECENANGGYNEVEITSKKNSKEPSRKTFKVQLGDLFRGEIGERIRAQLGDAIFSNMCAAPITFANGDILKDGSMAHDQDLHVKEQIKVPPQTRATATILTKTVTYEIKIVTELSVSADANVPMRFKGRFEKKFGSICTSTIRALTAEDLFGDEAGYKMVDGVITFTRDGTVSYTGEEVEIITDMDRI